MKQSYLVKKRQTRFPKTRPPSPNSMNTQPPQQPHLKHGYWDNNSYPTGLLRGSINASFNPASARTLAKRAFFPSHWGESALGTSRPNLRLHCQEHQRENFPANRGQDKLALPAYSQKLSIGSCPTFFLQFSHWSRIIQMFLKTSDSSHLANTLQVSVRTHRKNIHLCFNSMQFPC